MICFCGCACCEIAREKRWCRVAAGVTLFLVLMLSLGIVIGYVVLINDQVHISFANENATDIYITWVSASAKRHGPPAVRYRLSNDTANVAGTIVTGYTTTYKQSSLTSQSVHRVRLRQLAPGQEYHYIYGGSSSLLQFDDDSAFSFRTPRHSQANSTVKAVIFGDMGSINGRALPYVGEEIATGRVDFLFHLGDFAYDLYTLFGINGRYFMSKIEQVSSLVPYQTIPGNHEMENEFSEYRNLFTMPGYEMRAPKNDFFYALRIGPLKIVAINTELYYDASSIDAKERQKAWLAKELKRTNRSETPWLITMGHRPFYCSNTGNDDCTDGLRDKVRLDLESMFVSANVTIAFFAHEHSYERTCPIANGRCGEAKPRIADGVAVFDKPPRLPINIIAGSAGGREHLQAFVDAPNSWSAMRSKTYGYGVLSTNEQCLFWKQKAAAGDEAAVVDAVSICR